MKISSEINVGDPSLIGLNCESGDFSDCNLFEPDEPIPSGCEGKLIFSPIQSSCGSMCGAHRKKRSEQARTGWTLYYTNRDSPNGSGDHENYFEYLHGKKDRLTVYDLNGTAFTHCEKKAIHVRKRFEQT